MSKDSSEKRCTIFPRSTNNGGLLPRDDHFTHSSSIREKRPRDISDNRQVENVELVRLRRQNQSLYIGVPRTSEHGAADYKRQSSPFCREYSPWMIYRKFKIEGHPGKTCLAYEFETPGSIAAIKQYKLDEINKTKQLLRTSHTNIVNLLNAFADSGIVYLAYEVMEVSLEQMHSGVVLGEFEVSFICREVMHGLGYIHGQLSTCHMRIQGDTIFVSAQGRVKIADVGICLLEHHHGSESHDVKCVGQIASELLPSNDSTESGRKEFIYETTRSTIPVLLNHVYIYKAASDGCLVVPLMKVRGLVIHDYE